MCILLHLSSNVIHLKYLEFNCCPLHCGMLSVTVCTCSISLYSMNAWYQHTGYMVIWYDSCTYYTAELYLHQIVKERSSKINMVSLWCSMIFILKKTICCHHVWVSFWMTCRIERYLHKIGNKNMTILCCYFDVRQSLPFLWPNCW